MVAGVASPRTAGDQDVLVVAAVEHAHLARSGQGLADPPQETAPALLRRRSAERLDAHALRIHQADGVAHGAALAGGVHPLQDEQQPPLPARAAMREQALLQIGDSRCQPGKLLLPRHLVSHEARGRTRVVGGEVDRAGRQPQQVGDARVTWCRSSSASSSPYPGSSQPTITAG